MKTINVLFISPLSGFNGGIKSWTQRLMEHGLPNEYKIHIIDTGIYSKSRSRNMKTWKGEVGRTLRIMFSTLWHYTIICPQITHINYSVDINHKLGMFRDLICAILARLCCIKVVGHYRGDISITTGLYENRFYLWLLRSLIRVSNINIALNQNSLARMVDFQRSKQRAPVFLPNFIQDSVFRHSVDLTAKLPARVKILYVGRITSVKGCREFITAAQHFPEGDFKLLGPVKADMEPYLEALPDNVILGGDVDHDVVLREMISSDLFLFPTFHAEGFPNAVMEAMAMGLPVISTRAGAIPEMIDDGMGGLLIDDRDVDAIVSALRNLISEPDKLSRMGLYNRRKCQAEYSYSVVIDKLASIYQQIL